jgi:hypothetical protein
MTRAMGGLRYQQDPTGHGRGPVCGPPARATIMGGPAYR